MNARLLLEIALRVFGVWFVFHSINSLMSAASIYLSGFFAASLPNLPYLIAVLFVTFIVLILSHTHLHRDSFAAGQRSSHQRSEC